MTIIIHGDDIVASRNYLNKLISEFESKGLSILKFAADELTEEKVTLDLQPHSLFGDTHALVIEGLFSRRDSQAKKKIIALLAPSTTAVVIWEGKSIKKTDLNLFPTSQIQEFKQKTSIFEFLDSIGNSTSSVKAFHVAMRQEPVEKLIASINSRLHALLVAKLAPENLEAQGFYRTKLLSQAGKLSLEKIAGLISDFTQADYAHKTGNNIAPLDTSIDLILSNNQI